MLPYANPVYLTFKQAGALGGCVRKGEKGFPVLFWKMLQVSEENAASPEDVGKMIPFARYYTVFNVEQCDGLSLVLPEAPAAPAEFDPNAEAEAIWAGMPAQPRLAHGGARACYIPALASLRMPPRHAFDLAEGYYETLFHEMGHATGHQSRLNRKEIVSGSYFGARDYSLEELVAELCAAFLCAEAGVDQAVLSNQAAYIQGWLEKLKAEPAAFVTAAARAQKAADFILRRNVAEKPEEAA